MFKLQTYELGNSHCHVAVTFVSIIGQLTFVLVIIVFISVLCKFIHAMIHRFCFGAHIIL